MISEMFLEKVLSFLYLLFVQPLENTSQITKVMNLTSKRNEVYWINIGHELGES